MGRKRKGISSNWKHELNESIKISYKILQQIDSIIWYRLSCPYSTDIHKPNHPVIGKGTELFISTIVLEKI